MYWWLHFIEEYNGISMIKTCQWSEPDVFFSTDACLVGVGGINNSEFFHRRIPEFIQNKALGIVHFECLAIMLAIKVWSHLWHGNKISIYCDNEAVCHIINSGKTKEPVLLSFIREVAYYACTREFEIRVIHLSSEDNRLTDTLSRWHVQSEADIKCFYENTGLSADCEVHIPDNLFLIENDW